MKNKILKIREGLAKSLDIPRDIALNIPKITIVGDEEITIDNHKGILKFKDDLIEIKSNLGIISIRGTDFEILFISDNTIVLSGKFQSIEYGEK
ncbi:MAG: sporulation protein YqfC [Clostridium sp.]|nr:sporulation protein YqfC [Clostridium sp.]